MTAIRPRDVAKAKSILAGADGSLSPAEQAAYRDQLAAQPTLSLVEMRRLSWLLKHAPRR